MFVRKKDSSCWKIKQKYQWIVLFTNDEMLSAKLSHPKKEFKKTYHISLNNPLKSSDLKRIKDGLIIDGEKINIDSISYVLDKEKTEIGLELKSNKRNVISKIFNQLNYKN